MQLGDHGAPPMRHVLPQQSQTAENRAPLRLGCTDDPGYENPDKQAGVRAGRQGECTPLACADPGRADWPKDCPRARSTDLRRALGTGTFICSPRNFSTCAAANPASHPANRMSHRISPRWTAPPRRHTGVKDPPGSGHGNPRSPSGAPQCTRPSRTPVR